MKNYILSIAILALAGTPFASADVWVDYSESLENENTKRNRQERIAEPRYQDEPRYQEQREQYSSRERYSQPERKHYGRKKELFERNASYATMEGFYAGAAEDVVKNWEKVNIAGLWGTYGTTFDTSARGTFVDFAGILGFGGGSTEETYYGYNEYGKDEITQFDVFMGGQVGLKVQFTNSFSMTAGVMAGLDFRTSELEMEAEDSLYYYEDDEEDAAVGLFYGAFIRAETRLTNRWSLTASYRFMGTTTENEFSLDGYEKIKTEKVNYNMFTVGAKFEF